MADNGLDDLPEGYEEDGDDDLYYSLDDDRRAELNEMVGLKVLGIELWEESIADEEGVQPPAAEDRMFVDCDLYFDDNLALELYVTSVYPDPEGEPRRWGRRHVRCRGPPGRRQPGAGRLR